MQAQLDNQFRFISDNHLETRITLKELDILEHHDATRFLILACDSIQVFGLRIPECIPAYVYDFIRDFMPDAYELHVGTDETHLLIHDFLKVIGIQCLNTRI